MQPGYGPPATGERWNVNMPAVVGVVVVFLVGVVVWVVASSAGGDGDADAGSAVSTAAPAAASPTTSPVAAATPAPTLSPTPLPTSTTSTSTTTTTPATTTTAAEDDATTTTASPDTTAAPATTDVDADSDSVPGDLDIPGEPMQRPPCDGGYITIVGSPVGEQATSEAVGAVLDQYSGTSYLRTDRSCPSLAQDLDGEPIYVIYFGPFAVASDACAARSDGPDDAYAKTLSDDLEPDHAVDCL